jgi:hypothetical protein
LCIFLVSFVIYMGADKWKTLVDFHMHSVESPFYSGSKLGSSLKRAPYLTLTSIPHAHIHTSRSHPYLTLTCHRAHTSRSHPYLTLTCHRAPYLTLTSIPHAHNHAHTSRSHPYLTLTTMPIPHAHMTYTFFRTKNLDGKHVEYSSDK